MRRASISKSFAFCILWLAACLPAHQLPTEVKVAGSYELESRSYPFIAAIFSEHNQQAICSGALIAPQVVLTAARCFANVWSPERGLSVRMGQGVHTLSRSESIRVSKVITHPDFKMSQSGLHNDLALLLLKEPSQVRPIKLNRDSSLPKVGSAQKVTIPSVSDASATQPSISTLIEGDLTIIDRQSCLRARRHSNLPDTQICADHTQAESPIQACHGEIGGPLFSMIGEPVLFGVVSEGNGCARANTPGIYTRVSAFVVWIEQTLGERGGVL